MKPARFTMESFVKEDAKFPAGGHRCKVMVFELSLSPEELKTFRAAMADSSIASTAISRMAKTFGYDGTKSSIYTHRRDGPCSWCKTLGPKVK